MDSKGKQIIQAKTKKRTTTGLIHLKNIRKQPS